ncbi:HrpJ domain-containing protein [Rhabdochlamydiaceae symbiont of Dictyostelium giganteum]|uniref:HrpJ domain-containing protein n=1 Tax=Rhabdochlamydiaceae symbiont of Dictyostelium giganteum TaxID=3342349 RepID=UPI00384A7BE8
MELFHSSPSVPGVSSPSLIKQAMRQSAQKLLQYAVAQESVNEEFQEWGDLNAWNPLALAKRSQTLEKRVKDKSKAEESKGKRGAEEDSSHRIGKLESIAKNYERKNPELKAKTLLSLRSLITAKDSPLEILEKLKNVYLDIALVDEALEFLIDASDDVLKENLIEARNLLHKDFAREVTAGRNIGMQARNYAAKGLGSPTALRDLYRVITHTPFNAVTLFQELSLNFSLDKMQVVIHFILHSLGSDVKAKGPSIAPGELFKMMSETRDMQAVLGVYRYFSKQMPMIAKMVNTRCSKPLNISFDLLARAFVTLILEKYPTVERALLLSKELSIQDLPAVQIVIYHEFLTAMRQVSSRLFQSDKQYHDLLSCYMSTIESIEKRLEKEGVFISKHKV